jgi:beta-fructofuranosidase
MQYFKPQAADQFVGDCMPFYHDGTFSLFYLIDEGHHAALGGLGGHQWALATSRDLIHWEDHPLAIPITEAWEGSICTGSTFYHAGTYYGFYATRQRDRTQHLSLAMSEDGIHFRKVTPDLASPQPGYNPYDYRDPFVFHDEETGQFHMLITASLSPYPVARYGGCLAHLVSADLHTWELQDPILMPGLPGAPECPDYFYWNGWYYLIFSHALVAHYRLSRTPFGPWLRPEVDTFDGAWASVMKTAPFHGNRRIGVAWIGTREGDKDNGRRQWGGHTVFRELVQHQDGSLGARFPAEMIPAERMPSTISLTPVIGEVQIDGTQLRLTAHEGLAVASLDGASRDLYLRLRVEPQTSSAEFGLRLRASAEYSPGYELCFHPYEARVTLHDTAIHSVADLNRAFDLEVILKEDIIDVCIDKRRCIINRCPELSGDHLFFFCRNGEVSFGEIEVRAL